MLCITGVGTSDWTTFMIFFYSDNFRYFLLDLDKVRWTQCQRELWLLRTFRYSKLFDKNWVLFRGQCKARSSFLSYITTRCETILPVVVRSFMQNSGKKLKIVFPRVIAILTRAHSGKKTTLKMQFSTFLPCKRVMFLWSIIDACDASIWCLERWKSKGERVIFSIE